MSTNKTYKKLEPNPLYNNSETKELTKYDEDQLKINHILTKLQSCKDDLREIEGGRAIAEGLNREMENILYLSFLMAKGQLHKEQEQ